ncbi:MAG: hypothetical protein HYS86_02070 [Candidatus Chisholmbacteria bacterium]|nr:hypothetical protein [Candidatus Chisholmbacteria bacterium]
MAEQDDQTFIVPQDEPNPGTFAHWLWSLHNNPEPVGGWSMAETPQGRVSGFLSYESVGGKMTYCWNREPIDVKTAMGIIGATKEVFIDVGTPLE